MVEYYLTLPKRSDASWGHHHDTNIPNGISNYLLLLWTISFIVYRRFAGRRDSIIYLTLSRCRFEYRSNKLLHSLLITLCVSYTTYHHSVMNCHVTPVSIIKNHGGLSLSLPSATAGKSIIVVARTILNDTFAWFSHHYVSRIYKHLVPVIGCFTWDLSI